VIIKVPEKGRIWTPFRRFTSKLPLPQRTGSGLQRAMA